MSQQAEAERSLLSGFQARCDDAGLETALFPPSPEAPFHSLVVRAPGVGAAARSFDIQISGVPLSPASGPPDAAAILLQSFVELTAQVAPAARADLCRLIGQLNTQLPLGAFGLFAQTGVLCLRHCRLIDGGLPLDANVRAIDRETGLLLLVLGQFADLVLDLASGARAFADLEFGGQGGFL